MNTEHMIRDGKKLIRHWEHQTHSIDVIGHSEFTHGLIHGLRIMLQFFILHIESERVRKAA